MAVAFARDLAGVLTGTDPPLPSCTHSICFISL